MTARKSSLHLRGLELQVFLGWPEAERAQLQTISVDLEFDFAVPLKACVSDHLDDTFCYDQLIQTLEKNVRGKNYKLLEHLTHDIYQTLKKTVPENTKIAVRVKKMPQIQRLTGGAIFYFGD